MDGVTDAAFRYMVCKHSKPSLVITEFTNVEGLARGAVKMLKAFEYDEIERPILAQVYGVEIESFYKVAVMLCHMGFDGIDINMGCPANKVARRGSGAGLIRSPELAKKIIRIVKKAVADFANGISLEEAGVHPNIIEACREMKHGKVVRKELPVSVKTRIGYDSVVAEEWMKHLLEVAPSMISLHGRTLKQMYSGRADWEVIGRAARIVKEAGVKFLGNGDIESMEDAQEKIVAYGLDGVLVGRAAMGNPWFFGAKAPTMKARFAAIKEHAKYFQKHLGDAPFFAIRKHLAWYCRGFEGAKDLRVKFMKVTKPEEVGEILGEFGREWGWAKRVGIQCGQKLVW